MNNEVSDLIKQTAHSIAVYMTTDQRGGNDEEWIVGQLSGLVFAANGLRGDQLRCPECGQFGCLAAH